MIDLRSDTVTRPTPGMRAAIAAAASETSRCRKTRRSTSCRSASPSCSARSAPSSCRPPRWPTRSPSSCTAVRETCSSRRSTRTPRLRVRRRRRPRRAAHRRPAGHRRAAHGRAGARGMLDGRGCRRPAPRRARRREHAQRRRRRGGRSPSSTPSCGCREAGVGVHMDGARLMNAARARRAAPIGARVDTVTLCLSKGLGCPLGAILAGPADLMAVAWRRSSSSAARCARRASSPRRASTHSITTSSGSPPTTSGRGGSPRARMRAGLPVDLDRRRDELRPDRASRPRPALRDVRGGAERGRVGFSRTYGPTHIRAVTHLDLADDDIERAQSSSSPP